MTYYTCRTCAPHSTMDHNLHGKGECLIPDCTCTLMVEGDEFVREHRDRVSKEKNLKLAELRGDNEIKK